MWSFGWTTVYFVVERLGEENPKQIENLNHRAVLSGIQ